MKRVGGYDEPLELGQTIKDDDPYNEPGAWKHNMNLDGDEAEILERLKAPENLRTYVEQITEPRGANKYVCPLCGSGNGPKHTAAFSINASKPTNWYCFACQEGGDVIDLICKVEGLGFGDAKARAGELFGIDTGKAGPRQQAAPKTPPKNQQRKEADYSAGQERERQYIQAMRANISRTKSYLERRGWRIEEAEAYGLGYDPNKKRLILPWAGSDYYHIDRDVTGKAPNKYDKPKADEVGPQPIYNLKALEADSFVVVEGVLDALAVMRCGVKDVVALGGTGYRKLLDELKARHYQGGVVLMLDNDEPGREATEKFKKGLVEAGISGCVFGYEGCQGKKDADEVVALGTEAREKLYEHLSKTLEAAKQKAKDEDKTPNMALYDPMEITERIFRGDEAETPISTGFNGLDEIIGGGLTRGLYVIGATSSYGKTTYTVQIADAIAKSGQPVLFVTIEQSATEIVAKSLSRYTHDERNSIGGGLTAQEIVTATKRDRWSVEQWERFTRAADAYTTDVAANLRILEGIRRPSVADVKVAADMMAAEFGRSPVIMIDYLQLLAPTDKRDTEKQAVDANVTALRQFARDFKTPVWCVATLNRESYSGPVELDSYKESGAVEYGADYLFGLQPQGIAAEVEGVKSAVEKKLRGNAYVAKSKRQNPRQVTLTVLKNRQGETTGNDRGLKFSYYPRTNLFVEQ